MHRSTGYKSITSLVLAAGIMTSCAQERDPASEDPIDPLPGLYDVTLSGAGLLKVGGNEKARPFCVTAANRSNFPHMLVKKIYQLHYSCSAHPFPREGNAIGGK